jgi:hypothetical protein
MFDKAMTIQMRMKSKDFVIMPLRKYSTIQILTLDCDHSAIEYCEGLFENYFSNYKLVIFEFFTDS